MGSKYSTCTRDRRVGFRALWVWSLRWDRVCVVGLAGLGCFSAKGFPAVVLGFHLPGLKDGLSKV